MRILLLAILSFALVACQPPKQEAQQPAEDCSYIQFQTPGDVQAGGVQMIDLQEGYRVWTKRFGNSDKKVLILHGGPAGTHEYLECFQSFFPQANIEFYEYDQLGSYYSDQPDDTTLWTIDRFVEEVEQVRKALNLDSDNFYLLGQSWGGILAMEYALKYQDHLKGLIICNMTADFDKYEAYNTLLRNELRPSLIDSLLVYENAGDFTNETYAQLVFDHFYTKHICRLAEWPEPVTRSFSHFNMDVYTYMQGPSEFVPGGILKHWSVWDRLHELRVPTLTVGARYDSMNPEEMKEMASLVQHGEYLYCPNGSHLALWDDQQVFMDGVISFIDRTHAGNQAK
ncbi:MAG: proline iminopeptidase-family hydrolase [Flavobacteriales bacterium]|nr:proline iminopeptidase-family hydrolase [Flavobacteriales bacterium]